MRKKLKEIIGAFGACALTRNNNSFLIFSHSGAGCHPFKGNKKKLRNPTREA